MDFTATLWKQNHTMEIKAVVSDNVISSFRGIYFIDWNCLFLVRTKKVHNYVFCSHSGFSRQHPVTLLKLTPVSRTRHHIRVLTCHHFQHLRPAVICTCNVRHKYSANHLQIWTPLGPEAVWGRWLPLCFAHVSPVCHAFIWARMQPDLRWVLERSGQSPQWNH